jgi:hypothetical protein
MVLPALANDPNQRARVDAYGRGATSNPHRWIALFSGARLG